MSFLVGTASAQQELPDVLERVAQSVVQVRVGTAWGTGCLYPSSSHIATSYSLINQGDVIEVLLPTGRVSRARVVAWSELDELAILELAQPGKERALVPATQPAFAGMEVVVMGYPKRSDTEEQAQLVPRSAPTPRFARVSLAGMRVVAIDSPRVWTGDLGAPIVNESGQLVGVLGDTRGRQRGVEEAASAGALSTLAAQIGQQGSFEPNPPAERAWFGGVFATPTHTERWVGVGVWSGYRYDWLTLTLTGSFLRSGFEPTAENTFVAQEETALEAYASVDLELPNQVRVSIGPGAALVFVAERTRHVLATGVDEDQELRLRARPLVLAQFLSSRLILSTTVSLVDPSFRMDVGFAFGR